MILTQSCSIHNCILSRSFYYELLGALRTLVVCLRISKRKSNGGSLLCALPSEQGTGDLRGQSLQPESDSDLLWFTLILSWFRLCKSPAQCIQEDILPLCSSWCFSALTWQLLIVGYLPHVSHTCLCPGGGHTAPILRQKTSEIVPGYAIPLHYMSMPGSVPSLGHARFWIGGQHTGIWWRLVCG